MATNNKSALHNSDFVEQAINDLLVRGLAIECDRAPIVVNPLSVSTNNNKKRLILDLRKVNLHMWKQSIKYEDIHTALQYVESNSWMIKFDIHSAYHHVDIFPEHTEYLGFSWKMNGRICFFKFLVLPFGLSTAPYIFTKLSRVLVKKWRSQGIQILMYLDDGFACANCSANMLAVTKKIKGDLIDSGFVPKNEKSQWDPVQNLEFLGIEIDTKSNKLSVPKRRIDKAFSTIQKVKDNIRYYKGTKVRLLASLVGQLISMHVVVGNMVYIMTKSISTQIAQSQHWDNVVQLNINTIDQIEYWYRVIRVLEPKEILNIPYAHRIEMYSDASSTGYGGFSVQVMGQISHGMWSQEESLKSSTWRELAAVARVLDSMQKFLSYNSVKWFTDSQSVASVVSKGSMKPELQSLAMYIFNICVEKHISIEMEWIPRTLNDKADYLSRIVDYDDWGIHPLLFRDLDSLWGPHTCDWFASPHNCKINKFWSRYWCPGTSGVDAFTENWHGIHGWLCPPIALISRVLDQLKVCKSSGTLIIPYWPSAPFWPKIVSGGKYVNFIKDWRFLPTEKGAYTPGSIKGNLFGVTDLSFKMLALLLDFR